MPDKKVSLHHYDPQSQTLYSFAPLPPDASPIRTLVFNGVSYHAIEPVSINYEGLTSADLVAEYSVDIGAADDDPDDDTADTADDEAEQLPSYAEITRLVAGHYAALIEAGILFHEAIALTKNFQATLLA